MIYLSGKATKEDRIGTITTTTIFIIIGETNG